MRQPRIRRQSFGPVVALAILGCSGRDRSDATRVLFALEQVRGAPKEGKGPPAEALARVACSSPIVCATRNQCAEVYRHFAAGMDTHARVLAEIQKLEKNPPITTARLGELGAELDRAESEVNQAENGLPGCEQAVMLMRRKYGI